MAGNNAACCTGVALACNLTSLCSCSLKCCVLRLQAAWDAGAKLPAPEEHARRAEGQTEAEELRLHVVGSRLHVCPF